MNWLTKLKSMFFVTPQSSKQDQPKENFETWDWKAQDPEFYERFHKSPESKDPQIRAQVRWNRFNQVVFESGAKPKFNYSPRVFFTVMRWEVLIIFGSVCMGLMLPTLLKKRYEWDPTYSKHSGSQQNAPFANPRGDSYPPPQKY